MGHHPPGISNGATGTGGNPYLGLLIFLGLIIAGIAYYMYILKKTKKR